MYKNFSPEMVGISGQQSEIIELAMSHGFRSVSFDIVELGERAAASSPQHALRLINSAKLRLGCFRLPLESWEVDEATFSKFLAQLPTWGALAQGAQAQVAVTAVAAASDLRPYHENFELHRQRLQRAAEALQPFNVRLAVGLYAEHTARAGKQFQFIQDFDALLVLVNMLAPFGAGVALDVWQLVLAGGTIEDLRKLNGKNLLSVVLSDLPADANLAAAVDPPRLLPSEGGRIDCTTALSILNELGYEGPVTAAATRSTIDAKSRDHVTRQVGTCLDALWKAAGIGPKTLAAPVK